MAAHSAVLSHISSKTQSVPGVLLWILARCDDKIDARESAIGYLPNPEDICIDGLEGVTLETVEELLLVDTESWLEDVENIKAFYGQVGERVPAELYSELEALENRLVNKK